MKLRDQHRGPLTFEEHIGKHNNILKLPTILRLHSVLQVSNLRPCSNASFHLVALVTTLEDDDDELDVSHISIVCISRLIA
jgi:hypothetical protein